jgi:hypothetical protein
MSNQTGNSRLICAPGLPFGLPKGYSPSEFLYGEDGPWPSQPTNGNACKVAPEVQDGGQHGITTDEESDYSKYLGDYYTTNGDSYVADAIDYSENLLGVSLGLKKGILIDLLIGLWFETGVKPPVEPSLDPTGFYPALSDSSFMDLIAHGLLSKLMSKLDTPDEAIFQGFLIDKTREFWKCDLTHMRVVRKPLEGEYVAPSVVLLSRPKSPAPGQEYDFRVDCIALFVQSQPGGPYDKTVIFESGDGKAWQLAKYFALQGALVRINLIDHPMVHFPFDAINAITKSTLPKSSLILQLLLPHLFLSLPVDNRVLEGKYSLLNRTWTYPYSPYPAAGQEIRKVFPFYWLGWATENDAAETWDRGRVNAFPPYRFSTEPREFPSKYGTFLNAYYQPILNFARGVVKFIPTDSMDWEAISFWADHVASWIPGFPEGREIYKNDELLAKTCASIIWNGAIVHTTDHWLMHQMFEKKLPTPYIMRDKPPTDSASLGADPNYQPTVLLVEDVIPTRLCDLMFFMPHSTTLLSKFKYEFENDLGPLIKKFKSDMIATDNKLHKMFPEFGIKLYPDGNQDPAKDCFAAGVQF